MVLGRLLEGLQQAMDLPGETVAADPAEYLSSDSGEKPAEPPVAAAQSEAADSAATSVFSTAPVPLATAYVEPSSDPLAPTIAASGIPVLATEPETQETLKPKARFVPVSEAELDRAETRSAASGLLGKHPVVDRGAVGSWRRHVVLFATAVGRWTL